MKWSQIFSDRKEITMSGPTHTVNMMSHEGKCVSTHGLKVMLRTDTGKTTVECGSEYWRCVNVRFGGNGVVQSLDVVVRDRSGKKMEMMMPVDQLHFRNGECLDNPFKQLGIAFFRCG